MSPCRSLDFLQRWTMGEAPLSIADARQHIIRVSQALITITQSLETVIAAVEGFRAACEHGALAFLEAMDQGEAFAAEIVTARAEEFLLCKRLPAWSFAGRRRPSPELGSLVVETIVYGEDEPDRLIVDGICRFHDRLANCGESIDDGVLFVLRLGGPRCELPRRLELEQFAMTLVPIDLSRTRHTDSACLQLGAEEILDAICRSDSSAVPPTLRSIAGGVTSTVKGGNSRDDEGFSQSAIP